MTIDEPFRGAAHTRLEELPTDFAPLIDSDKDGILDDQELEMGLDPLDRDTDDDEINDGDEYIYWSRRSTEDIKVRPWHRLIHGDVSKRDMRELIAPLGDMDGDGDRNILDVDSDDDGITDGNELRLGTDPANPDTDGDTLLDYYDPNILSNVDLDQDGLPDDWEEFFGVDDPYGDPDGDGVPNKDEFKLGTNPKDNEGTSDLYHKEGEGEKAVRPVPGDRTPRERTAHVFYARTEVQRPYWKIATFDAYTSDGWVASPGTRPEGAEELDQSLRHKKVVTDLTFPSAWTGYLPVVEHQFKVNRVTPSLVSVVPIRSGELEAKNPVIAVTYVSVMYDLRSVFEDPDEDLVIDAELWPYLAVPFDFGTRLWEYGWSLSNVSGDGYLDRALTAAGAIYRRCKVVDPPMEDVPEWASPATYVLFDSEDGEGSHYDIASAYVLLVRTMGVPSRLVVGYRGGLVGDDKITVLNSHAWTWAEVLVPGMGWVRIDPTMPNPLSVESFGESPGPIDDGGPWWNGTWVEPDPNVPGDDWTPRDPPGDNKPWKPDLPWHPPEDEPPDDDWVDPPEIDPDGDLDGDGIRNADDLDADGDGLEWPEEVAHGTSDYLRDTDHDGLDDYQEVMVYGTDPLNIDTDNDGVLDGIEVNTLNTDPLNPDTDGGGVEDGLEIRVGTNPLDPYDDDAAADDDHDGLTNLQELLLGTNPLDPDSDNDNLPDGVEHHLGTDPLRADTDGDGLSDFEELQRGTNPNNPDTDDNEVPDGEEPDEGNGGTGVGPDPPDPTGDDPFKPTLPNEWDFDDPPSESGGMDDGEGWRGLVALLAAIALLGIYLAWRRMHVRELEDILDLAEEELYRLDLEDLDGVRQVIIQTYKRFCRVLMKYGFLRKESWTAREFQAALEDALFTVPYGKLKDLTFLFEEARYSDHVLPIEFGSRARACLRGVRSYLTVAPGDMIVTLPEGVEEVGGAEEAT